MLKIVSWDASRVELADNLNQTRYRSLSSNMICILCQNKSNKSY